MEVGFLVILNWAVLPFISEADEIAVRGGIFPKFLLLRSFRRQRWALGHIFILVILVAADQSGTKSHPAGDGLMFFLLALHAFLWAWIAMRKAKSRKDFK